MCETTAIKIKKPLIAQLMVHICNIEAKFDKLYHILNSTSLADSFEEKELTPESIIYLRFIVNDLARTYQERIVNFTGGTTQSEVDELINLRKNHTEFCDLYAQLLSKTNSLLNQTTSDMEAIKKQAQ